MVGMSPSAMQQGQTAGPAQPYAPQVPQATAAPSPSTPPSFAVERTLSPYAKRDPRASTLGDVAGLVMVQAPDGETRRMPRRQAEQYVARGAQIVG
jgi:hypothetical protein